MTDKNKAAGGLADNAKDRALDVRHDFILALRRLVAGETQRVKVRPKQKITPALLAREADRARSQLYTTHADLLSQIAEANEKRTTAAKANKKIRQKSEQELRDIINQLSRDKELLAQQNYRLQHRIDDLERDSSS
jgi:hypothetical protein